MESRRLGDRVGMKEEMINKTCALALRAHSSDEEFYVVEKSHSSAEVVFGFPGYWSVNNWFSKKPFGETKINLSLFPLLRSIGNDEAALVNEAFQLRFESVLVNSTLQDEVEKAVREKKKVIFTGHASGAAIAILATIWALDKYSTSNTNHVSPLCLTFGSPLVGNHIFSHVLRRENWTRCFIHFIMRYDVIPRIFLSPLSSIESKLEAILQFFNPKSRHFMQESIGRSNETYNFFLTVLKNASTITTHVACKIMGSTNLLMETVTNFVELTPYRPFGTFVFCTGNGRFVFVTNANAVLQLLYYSSQTVGEAEAAEVAYRSLKDHLVYETELKDHLEMQKLIELNQLEEIPLSGDGGNQTEMINETLNDMGLSTRARLCLRAAGALEKQKLKNLAKIEKKKDEIEKGLMELEKYREMCEVPKVGYYDAFKFQKDVTDFKANVKRLELAGIWDEIIEMLKRYELPDEYEGMREWIVLGTRYRRLVEPLDIANYYRHLMNDDTGPYMKKGRPKRYRYTQRWREYIERMAAETSSESCFWAEVEELCIQTGEGLPFEDLKGKVQQLEKYTLRWTQDKELREDVFLEASTFTKWWKTLPAQHKQTSCIKNLIT